MGGKTKTSGQGRPKGALNKSTRSVRELAANFSEHAVGILVRVMADQTAPHASRIAAARELLDRAHGKPSAAVLIKLPAGASLAEKGEAAIAAAAAGNLPLDHLATLMNALQAQAKLTEVSEIQERLEVLETLIKGRSTP